MKLNLHPTSTSIFLLLLMVAFLVPSSCLAKATLTFSTAEKSALQMISATVLTRAYAKLGLNIEVIEYPNARSLLIANSGKVDGELSRIAGIEKEFENLIPVPTAINSVSISAFGLVYKPKAQRPADLHKLKLGCVKGIKIVEDYILEQNLNCTDFIHIDQALSVLSLERVDILLLPELNGYSAINRLNHRNVTEVAPKLSTQMLYHYLHHKQSHLIKSLNNILESMKEAGEIDEIRRSYIDKMIPKP
ncbi:MAG: hypothetical protein C9356_17130 [Oleiphilus sp.]|nr:MAG: hypothetical protein C9356_17130 [Oleiphilus sp.]